MLAICREVIFGGKKYKKEKLLFVNQTGRCVLRKTQAFLEAKIGRCVSEIFI